MLTMGSKFHFEHVLKRIGRYWSHIHDNLAFTLNLTRQNNCFYDFHMPFRGPGTSFKFFTFLCNLLMYFTISAPAIGSRTSRF